jgi:transposase
MTTDEATASCDDGKAARQRKPPSPIDLVQGLLANGELNEVVSLVAELVANNSALQRQLEELTRKRYKTSEVVSSAQLRLLLTELAQVEEQAESLSEADEELRKAADLDALEQAKSDGDENGPRPRKRKRPARRPFPEKLRRVENPILVPAEQRPCPKCGKERTCIGHDVTEVLELVPAELVVRRDKREKLACKACDGELCRAPMPDKVISRGRLGVMLVACMLVEKYRDGLPLHRQLQRFRRLGVSLPLSTLVDQVKHSAQAAKVLQEAAIDEVLSAHVMHLDGTGMPVLDKAHRNGKRLGSLWAYVGDGNVSVYLYASTGKKNGQQSGEVGPEDFLNRRKGLVVADASNLFDASFRRDDLIECGCNAHYLESGVIWSGHRKSGMEGHGGSVDAICLRITQRV